MKRYSHGLRHLALAAALLGLGACGGCRSENEAQSAAARSGTLSDPCGDLSVEAAADLLTTDPEDLVRKANPEAAVSCAFTSRSDPAKVLAYSVRSLDSEAAAEARLESMAQMLEKISPVERTPEPGDEAIFASGPKARRAAARRGSVVIDLIEPTDPELQRRALAAIVGGL